MKRFPRECWKNQHTNQNNSNCADYCCTFRHRQLVYGEHKPGALFETLAECIDDVQENLGLWETLPLVANRALMSWRWQWLTLNATDSLIAGQLLHCIGESCGKDSASDGYIWRERIPVLQKHDFSWHRVCCEFVVTVLQISLRCHIRGKKRPRGVSATTVHLIEVVVSSANVLSLEFIVHLNFQLFPHDRTWLKHADNQKKTRTDVQWLCTKKQNQVSDAQRLGQTEKW